LGGANSLQRTSGTTIPLGGLAEVAQKPLSSVKKTIRERYPSSKGAPQIRPNPSVPPSGVDRRGSTSKGRRGGYIEKSLNRKHREEKSVGGGPLLNVGDRESDPPEEKGSGAGVQKTVV